MTAQPGRRVSDRPGLLVRREQGPRQRNVSRGPTPADHKSFAGGGDFVEGEDINPDEVYGPTQPLFKQLLDACAEENAVVDAIYYTSEGLRKGVVTLDVFLKSVRELSRRQFMLRALMRACRTKASLPS